MWLTFFFEGRTYTFSQIKKAIKEKKGGIVQPRNKVRVLYIYDTFFEEEEERTEVFKGNLIYIYIVKDSLDQYLFILHPRVLQFLLHCLTLTHYNAKRKSSYTSHYVQCIRNITVLARAHNTCLHMIKYFSNKHKLHLLLALEYDRACFTITLSKHPTQHREQLQQLPIIVRICFQPGPDL